MSRSYFLLILLLLLLSFNGCTTQKRLVRDTYTLKRGEGLIAFRLHYLEGLPTFKLLTINIEDLDRIFLKRFRVRRNSNSVVLFPLRAGRYFFSTLQAQVEQKNPQSKVLNSSFEGRILENTFLVEPGRMNYIGDLLLQVQREHSGKPFVLVGTKKGSSSVVQYPMYLLHYFSEKTVKKIRDIYPRLSQNYKLFQEPLSVGSESLAIKENYLGRGVGYGEENYGLDSGGYGEYQWGMSKEEVRKLLKDKGEPYEEESEANRFVSILPNGSRREYYFSSIAVEFWNERLYKVSLYLKAPVDKVLERVSGKYGSARQKEKTWIWEIPSTLVILLEEGKESLLSYVSKEHERIEFLEKRVSSSFSSK